MIHYFSQIDNVGSETGHEGSETREVEGNKIEGEAGDIESGDEKCNQSFWRENLFHGD